jgi:hypothetical protein
MDSTSDPDAIVPRCPTRRSTQTRPSLSITYFVTAASAHDHHAFHEDAVPGDLGFQLFGTRRFSSSKKFWTRM